MKQILIVLLLSLTSFQLVNESNVHKYRAFKYKLFCLDHEPYESEDINILVVINFDKMKVHTYGKREMDIDLIQQKNLFYDKNENMHVIYQAVDNDGVNCNLEIILFKNQNEGHLATLTIEYNGCSLVYRLKSNN